LVAGTEAELREMDQAASRDTEWFQDDTSIQCTPSTQLYNLLNLWRNKPRCREPNIKTFR